MVESSLRRYGTDDVRGWKLIVHRIDGAEKVAGQAVYAGDLRLPGMAYAKVLRSPVPHARIRRIDAARPARCRACSPFSRATI